MKLRLFVARRRNYCCGDCELLGDVCVVLIGQVLSMVSTRVTLKSVALALEPLEEPMLEELLGLALDDEPVAPVVPEVPALEPTLLGLVELDPMLPVEPVAEPEVPPVLAAVVPEAPMELPEVPVLALMPLPLPCVPSTFTCWPTLLLRSSELLRRKRWSPFRGCR